MLLSRRVKEGLQMHSGVFGNNLYSQAGICQLFTTVNAEGKSLFNFLKSEMLIERLQLRVTFVAFIFVFSVNMSRIQVEVFLNK